MRGGKGERVRYLVISYHLYIALDSVINWFPQIQVFCGTLPPNYAQIYDYVIRYTGSGSIWFEPELDPFEPEPWFGSWFRQLGQTEPLVQFRVQAI